MSTREDDVSGGEIAAAGTQDGPREVRGLEFNEERDAAAEDDVRWYVFEREAGVREALDRCIVAEGEKSVVNLGGMR
jgi:hypothetical protein